MLPQQPSLYLMGVDSIWVGYEVLNEDFGKIL